MQESDYDSAELKKLSEVTDRFLEVSELRNSILKQIGQRGERELGRLTREIKEINQKRADFTRDRIQKWQEYLPTARTHSDRRFAEKRIRELKREVGEIERELGARTPKVIKNRFID